MLFKEVELPFSESSNIEQFPDFYTCVLLRETYIIIISPVNDTERVKELDATYQL